jgi:signal transduction histidine kinase
MAVEKEKQQAPILMRDYLNQFQKRSLSTIAGICLSTSVCITTLLSLCGLMPLWSIPFWATFVIIGTFMSASSIWLFWKLGQPFRDIVREVIVIGGEPTALTPPNPNTRNYGEDGFKQILQTIYELASKEKQPAVIPMDPDEPLHTGLDHTSTGIIIFSADRDIIYSNKKAPVMISSRGEKKLDLLFPPAETLEAWLNECEEKSVHTERIWTRLSDKPPGERGRRIYDMVASYQKNSTAETVLTFFDRTDTYAPEEDDLDFISFAAHELRGPITVIRGYLDVLDDELQPVLENDQAELLQRLIVSSNRLSSYVNNILNASRYDRRHFKVHLSEEKLIDIYDTIKDDMQLRAQSQNRLLSIDIPDSLPTVAADKNGIGEVLSNLVDNAIKYSNEGGLVIVKARAISGHVEVSIIDRGIGMPVSVIPNLFHKFYRSHRSRETVAGTGIGLYISKAIVESHGGIIEVRSTEREGSTFAFTLPIYDTVADKIKAGNNSNELLVERSGGWIRNHSMYRG